MDDNKYRYTLTFFDVNPETMSKASKEHIFRTIQEGYSEGEIIEDCYDPDKNGWWKWVKE